MTMCHLSILEPENGRCGLRAALLLSALGVTTVALTASAPASAGTGRDLRVDAGAHGTTARWLVDGLRAAAPAPGVPLRGPGAPLTVYAHRGASSAAPENTLLADEVARRSGVEWIENDVQPSKDGVPYVLHDETVNRTTSGTGRIRDLTAAQLDALDAGSWFAPAFAGARVPSLAAQLDDLHARGGSLLLEIKGPHSRDEVARVVQDIRDHDMAGRVLVQSFDADALRLTRELAPDLPLALLRSELDADPVAVAGELGLSAYHPSDSALASRPEIVTALHAAGVAVNVWTVDAATRWKVLDAAGVDGIITNHPAELAGWLSARP
ncbi:glycerophosphodiester phosphodiesterase [Kitasatospora sp. NPDC059463]|uniref:glycerophosphodiester phosphodiesterase n=1 Tax=unclassified Kitasatospora TaxID=2633591 RepID=UPI003692C1A7